MDISPTDFTQSAEFRDLVLDEMSDNIQLISPDAADGQIGQVIKNKHPDLKHLRFSTDLLRALDQLEKEGYIKGILRPISPVEGVHPIKHYSITALGRDLVRERRKQKVASNTVVRETTASIVAELNRAVTRMPEYGYYHTAFMFNTPQYKDFKERMEDSGLRMDVINLLRNYGFITERRDLPKLGDDYPVQLSDRGRRLKELGGWERFFEEEEKQREQVAAELEHREVERELLRLQRDNAQWQVTRGNSLSTSNRTLTIISIGVAASSALIALATMLRPNTSKEQQETNRILQERLLSIDSTLRRQATVPVHSPRSKDSVRAKSDSTK